MDALESGPVFSRVTETARRVEVDGRSLAKAPALLVQLSERAAIAAVDSHDTNKRLVHETKEDSSEQTGMHVDAFIHLHMHASSIHPSLHSLIH